MLLLDTEICMYISCAAYYLLTLAFFDDLQHAFKDGTQEEVKLRHLGAADGSTVIVKDVRCTSAFFLEILLYCIPFACEAVISSIIE